MGFYTNGVANRIPTTNMITVYPTGTTQDVSVAQAAANQAAQQGVDLFLGPGTWNFTIAGVYIGGGISLNRRGTADAFRGLKIFGAGIGQTVINIGSGIKAFWWANDSAQVSVGAGAYNMSIIGPGINSGAVGLQFGGKNTAFYDLLELVEIRNVLIDNVTSCVIADDVSGLSVTGANFLRFKYGWEWGYNVDTVAIRDSFFTPDNGYATNQACTITNGSNVITGLPALCVAQLQVGYAVSAPGSFPRGSYIGSINTVANSVTVVDFNNVAINATAGRASANFYCGRVFNFGLSVAATAGTLYPSNGSTFVSPRGVIEYGVQGRIGASRHVYESCLINQVEMVTDMPGNSHVAISHRVYTEQTCLIARFGQPTLNTQAGAVDFTGCYFGFASTLVDAPFRVEGAQQGFAISIRNCASDSPAIAYPWFISDTYNYGRPSLTWENNRGLQTTTPGPVQIGDVNTNACWPSIGQAFYANSPRRGDSFEVRDSGGNWHWHGQDRINISLAGGTRTLNNPLTWSLDMTGKELMIAVTGQTGNSLTLGSQFLKPDGTAFGTLASGATGTRALLRFTWYDDAQRFIQVSPSAFF